MSKISGVIRSVFALADKWRRDPHKREEIKALFKGQKETWMNTNITVVNVCFKTMRLKDKAQGFVMSLELRDGEWVLIDAHFDGLSVSAMYGERFVNYINIMYADELLEKELL